MLLQKYKIFPELWRQAWTLPAKLNPWRWAEENISFSSRVSPLPGRYSTASTPYVREVLEAAANPTVRHITMCWSAQSSKTTTGLMIIFYNIANNPGNILLVRPSLQAAKSLSENRLMLVIDENKALTKFKTSDRDDYQKVMIKLKNMVIFVRGASANQLSAESCKVVFLDETDKYEAYREDKAEADLVSLAYERTKFYRDSLKLDTSTPTVPSGIIWKMYKEGDQRVYMLPCKHCGAEFHFNQQIFKFDSKNPKKTAYMECPHCGGEIHERDKPALMAQGRWVPLNHDADGEHRSYLLPEFYSPITKWGELADKFVKASHDAKIGNFGKLHNYINSSLAEPWDPTENARRTDDQILRLCDERERGTVPNKAVGLTIGVDTQDLYFEYVIRAWGADNMESWLVQHGQCDDFDALRNIMKSKFPSVDGTKQFRISGGLIDSGGHRTSEVYDFCRKYPRLRLRPSKGERKMIRPWAIAKIDKKPNGDPIIGGIKLTRVDTTYYKDLLAGKLSLDIDNPGAFRLHKNIELDYVLHMTAEYRDSKGVWQCPGHRHNESWDCEVLNFCCVDMLSLRFVQPDDKTPDDDGDEGVKSAPKKSKSKSKMPRYAENPYTAGIKAY